MKSTGIIRRVDDLGRVVLPKEMRDTMGIKEGDPLEFYTSGDEEIVLKKYCVLSEQFEKESKAIAMSLSKNTGLGVAICNECSVIAMDGMPNTPESEWLGQPLSQDHLCQMKSIREEKDPRDIYGFCLLQTDSSPIVGSVRPIYLKQEMIGVICFITEAGEVMIMQSWENHALSIAADFLSSSLNLKDYGEPLCESPPKKRRKSKNAKSTDH